jgi:hypothetical protein
VPPPCISAATRKHLVALHNQFPPADAGDEDADSEALMEMTRLLYEIQDIEYETSEELASATAATKCAVRFVRAERVTTDHLQRPGR